MQHDTIDMFSINSSVVFLLLFQNLIQLSSQIFELCLAVTLCHTRRCVNCSEITEISAAFGSLIVTQGMSKFSLESLSDSVYIVDSDKVR